MTTRTKQLLAGAAILILLVVLSFAGARSNDGPPLDPTSTGDLGTRGLVLLLQDLGQRVDVTSDLPGPETKVALVLLDTLNQPRTDALSRWVDEGGTLVVTDPRSSLIPSTVVGSSQRDPLAADTERLTRRCNLPALGEVNNIDPSGGVVFDKPEGGSGCFPHGRGFFVTASAQGEGNIVAIGGPAVFVNSVIGKGDNSVLAASLLAATPGGRVTLFDPRHSDPGVAKEGGKSLGQLIPSRLKRAFWQLVIAFGLFVLLRGRRLGRPVLEPQPVPLAGSEIVVAVGNLLQQAKQRDAAANLLRADLRRTLSDRLGLSPDAPDEVVADQAATRAGIDRQQVLDALRTDPLPGEPALVALAQSVASVRQEVDHAR
ncbi:MAG: hypothetical protein QOG03_765 [Actinomycetota bacterium]|jgi:hypothetical protein|nr:hypothetical protein [Actinomycetota bacterium]